jgi:hypothetical protein
MHGETVKFISVTVLFMDGLIDLDDLSWALPKQERTLLSFVSRVAQASMLSLFLNDAAFS